MMKILMMHAHDIWANEEPWTSRIRNIAREFVARGHEVRIIYFAFAGRERCVPQDDVFTSFRLRRSKWWIFFNILAVMRHAAWADVIHFQKCFAHVSIPAVIAHALLNKPLHYDWDDWEYQIYNFDPPSRLKGHFLDFIERRLPALVDTISVSSRGIRQLALDVGFPADRIVKAHVCADLKAFRPMADGEVIRRKYSIDRPVVMYMGQLHGGQYAYLFVEAAAKVLRTHDVLFMLVGSGSREPLLFQQVVERNIHDRVIFTGAVRHEEIPSYLAVCDVAVACFEDNDITRHKSPLKIVEYMACGKAVVASDVGEVPIMLGDAGLLVRPGKSRELARGIITLLDDEKKRTRCEKKARVYAEKRFDWSVTAGNILDAYTMALNDYHANGKKGP